MWLRAKLRVLDRVLLTQTRVDENRLKARKLDVLPRLLEAIAEAKRVNPQLVAPL